jgi:hypothetical protein
MTDETTGETTSHSTRLSAEELLAGHPKDDSQVAGYGGTTDMTTSHLTRLPAEELLMKPLAIRLGCQIASAKSLVMAGRPKDGNQVAGYNSMVLIALVIGVTFSLPVAAKLYKWVDDKGTTHYGETIPPEFADKSRSELNNSGREIKKIEVTTPAERKAKKQAEEQKQADEKADLEKKRHDMMLTNTYSNVKEIDLARNRSLQQVNARINNNNSQLKMANDNLLGLQKESEGYTKANKQIPASLQEDLDESQARLDKLQQNLEKSLAEKAAVEARYDADKARYRELTGK